MRCIIAGLCCWLWAIAAHAQHEWDTWCLGADTCTGSPAYPRPPGGAQVRFGPGGPGRLAAVRRHSSGSYSDAQGNLLFYTDGLSVYDRRNQPMPNGQQLASPYFSPIGVALAGQVAIHPVPGDATRCYLFYFKGDATPYPNKNKANAILCYAIVDLQANGGYGAVTVRDQVVRQTNLPKITLVRHANNVDFWVVTQSVWDTKANLPERGFRVFGVTAAGVSRAPVVSLPDTAAYANGWVLRASPDGQQLVSEGNRLLTLAKAGASAEFGLYAYNFDNSSGQVSQERLVRHPAPWINTKIYIENNYLTI